MVSLPDNVTILPTMVAVMPAGKVPTDRKSPAYGLVRVMVALTMLAESVSAIVMSVSAMDKPAPFSV